MLEFGKRYTWDEIIEAYPNKYVFINSIQDGDARPIESAVLLDVSDFEEIGNKAKKLREAGVECSCFWTKGPIQEGVFWF